MCEAENAYDRGYRAGRLDRLLGCRSGYAWHAPLLDPAGSYSFEYGLGYRRAFTAIE